MSKAAMDDYEINVSTYEWSVRLFRILRKILRLNVKLHHSEGQVAAGEIFLFNHFARFETFIPQYLIFEETGALCRSVAAAEFFQENDAFSNYLRSVGAVSNNHPSLFAFLAMEVLRGRKVVVFPEGGMVKDRRVVDDAGGFSVYSRMARERRKHHSGAAVLGLAVDAFKTRLLQALEMGETDRLAHWSESLSLEQEALIEAARRPTVIVPANITFYPIRVSDNILRKGMDAFSRGLSRRVSEEFLIEGNILLKDTDMDIRLGDPVQPGKYWRWWERRALMQLIRRLGTLDELFVGGTESAGWDRRLAARALRGRAVRVRDTYMRQMYSGVTVNLSHIASRVIFELLNDGATEIERETFHTMLYIAVKRVQQDSAVHLHRSLQNPEAYGDLLQGECAGLAQFLRSTASAELVGSAAESYQFLPKLCAETEFDQIRLENPVAVYANEVQPVAAVCSATRDAVKQVKRVTPRQLADHCFDDELLSYRWDKAQYSKPRHQEINTAETATETGEPYLLLPKKKASVGVLLVHGFLASPAELRPFGEQVFEQGHVVLGVRLKGHGTSPWDLRERSWQDWMASVRRGYRILSAHVERVAVIGFSTGGSLALQLAAERPEKLAGVGAVAVPMRFMNKKMIFVPLVHSANRLVRWVSNFEGVMPFRLNETERPDTNYRQMPLRGLHELRRLVDELQERLPEVQCPACLIQGTKDPVVDPKSLDIVQQRLGSESKTVHWVESDRHGLLSQDIGDTRQILLDFLQVLAAASAEQG